MTRIVKNTTAVGLAFLCNTVLTFVQIKLLTAFMAKSQLGEYSTTMAIGALVSVFAQLGLPMVVVRFVAKYDALGDHRRLSQLLWLAWGVVVACGAAVVALESQWIPPVLARLYDVPPQVVNVVLATCVFVATALRSVTYAGFDGLRRMFFPAVFENVNIAVVTAGIAMMQESATVPRILALAALSGGAVWLVAAATWQRITSRRVQGQSPSPGGLVRDIAPFWSGAALNNLVGICFGYADKVLISLFLAFEVVSVFYVAERLTFLMKRLLALPLQVASPEMTRRWELGKHQELAGEFRLLLKMQLFFAVGAAAVAIGLAESAVLLVARDAYLEAARLLRILSVSVVLMALYAPVTTLMRAIDRIHWALVSDVIWIVIYVGGGALAVPRWGLLGIAAAQLAASLVTFGYNFWVGQRTFGLSWDGRAVVKILVAGAAVAAVGGWAAAVLGTRWWVVLVGAPPLLVLYRWLVLRLGGVSVAERQQIGAMTAGSRLAGSIDWILFGASGQGREGVE